MSGQNAERDDSLRAVIDTNVLLLGMFTRGLSLPIIQAWLHNEFDLVISGELLDELVEVAARPKFKKHITATDTEKLVELIYRKADVVVAATSSNLGRDPDDYPVLGTAIVGYATHIVTADKDLLDDSKLKLDMKRRGIEVVSAGEFLQALKARRKH